MKSNLWNQDIRTEIYTTAGNKNWMLDLALSSEVDINAYNFLPDILEDDYYANRLVQKIYRLNLKNSCQVDINIVKKAIYYAKNYHKDQIRLSGEPYYSHPIEVAYLVSDHCFKTDIIVTSILHDIVEDTSFTLPMVEAVFGFTIASQVESLTRNTIYGRLSVQELIEPLYQQKNNDILIIKMIDRLHNMRTISAKSVEKQYKIASETMRIFVPLAQYLQILKIEQELAELCMAILNKVITFSVGGAIQKFSDN